MRITYVIAFVMVATLVALLWGIKQTLDRLAALPDQIVENVELRKNVIVAEIQNVFQGVLQIKPEIQWEKTVVEQQTAPIAEFAVVERDFALTYQWSHKWLGSTKQIQLKGTFKAKAGFDLRDSFLVRVDAETGRIDAVLPPAKVLSVEQSGELHFDNDEGWWNRIEDEERQAVVNEFLRHAKAVAERSTLRDEAEQQVLVRLQELAHKNKQRIIFSYRLP